MWVFLIIVVHSQSSNMQVEPMESMSQCQASIQAIKKTDDEASWSESLPRMAMIKCVEVPK